MKKSIKSVKIYTKSGTAIEVSADLKEQFLKSGFLETSPKIKKGDK